MKALILNGSQKGDDSLALLERILVTELEAQGWNVDSILLHEKKIANCMGCFGCWTKTPGLCVINDFGRQIPGQMINSDLVVYLSPVTFGGYSSVLKKAMDRIVPLMMPFFMKIDGEIHHKTRYAKYPRMMSLGLMPGPDDESEKLFRALLTRNAINFHAPGHASEVFLKDDSEEKIRAGVARALVNAGVKK
jgi:multimeric flavodoxin WrbA